MQGTEFAFIRVFSERSDIFLKILHKLILNYRYLTMIICNSLHHCHKKNRKNPSMKKINTMIQLPIGNTTQQTSNQQPQPQMSNAN
jgi:hypothetical protein